MTSFVQKWNTLKMKGKIFIFNDPMLQRLINIHHLYKIHLNQKQDTCLYR